MTAVPATQIVRRARIEAAGPENIARLSALLGAAPLAHVFLFVSPRADFAATVRVAAQVFGDTPLSACTTAGEIGPQGYCEDSIIAVGLPASHFETRAIMVGNLDKIDGQGLVNRLIWGRREMALARPNWGHEFIFTLIDGLSLREEALLQSIAPGLGGVPLFGGSAGDNAAFEQTWVAHDGRTLRNAAVICQVRTRCPVRVFSLDHFIPTDRRLIVTSADPEQRIVAELNGEPAAGEYARFLDTVPDELSPGSFAANPLAVRVGESHYVRGILRRGDNDCLEFASAIDVGLVLCATRAREIAAHLSARLEGLNMPASPDAILACDCLWRRVEIADRQATRRVSKILSDSNVIGFNTLGEQIDGLHVNQTMTGVAIYPPV